MDLFKNYSKYLNGYTTISVFARLLIPQLKPTLKKAIHFDCDIVVTGDLKELYDVDLGKYSIAATPEFHITPHIVRDIKLINHKYFNAGVMLFDCTKFKSTFLGDILSLLDKNIKMADQDLLNKYFCR
jgi:lipopolysaccharide biosynthesis glycosyltransferase